MSAMKNLHMDTEAARQALAIDGELHEALAENARLLGKIIQMRELLEIAETSLLVLSNGFDTYAAKKIREFRDSEVRS